MGRAAFRKLALSKTKSADSAADLRRHRPKLPPFPMYRSRLPCRSAIHEDHRSRTECNLRSQVVRHVLVTNTASESCFHRRRLDQNQPAQTLPACKRSDRQMPVLRYGPNPPGIAARRKARAALHFSPCIFPRDHSILFICPRSRFPPRFANIQGNRPRLTYLQKPWARRLQVWLHSIPTSSGTFIRTTENCVRS